MPDPQWLQWANRIRAIARAGLTYSENAFDRERYDQLQALAAEIIAAHTDADLETVAALLEADLGYPTPKVDVRGVVFQGARVLLVREVLDGGRWTLPGGWADVYDSPGEAAAREVLEESGYEVRPVKLLAVYDRNLHDHPPHPDSIYKLFFLCELIAGEPTLSIETSGVDFFPVDDLPELSLARVLPWQIARFYEHAQNPTWPTEFD